MNHLRTSFLPVLLLTALLCQGQEPSSYQKRQATPNGPYPLYISLQAIQLGKQDVLLAVHDGLDINRGTFRSWGFEGSAGFVYVPKGKENWRVTPLFELGFKTAWRSYQKDGDGYKFNQLVYGARVGFRFVVFYPLTVQVQAGLIANHKLTVDVLENNSRSAIRTGIADSRWGINEGYDIRLRVALFDGVGSGGGLGFFVEAQYLVLPDYGKNALAGVSNALDIGTLRGGSFSTHVISFGVNAPLALRWN